MRVFFRSAVVAAAVLALSSAAPRVFAQASTTILSAVATDSNAVLVVQGTNLCGPNCARPVRVMIGTADQTAAVHAGWTATDLVVDIPADVRAHPGAYQLRISATTAPGRTASFEVQIH